MLSTSIQLFPLSDIAGCEPYTPTVRGWCGSGDEFCGRGNDTKVRTGYFMRYAGEAVEFVVGRYNTSVVERAEPTVLPTASRVPDVNAGAKGVARPGCQLVVASGLLLASVVLGRARL
jgi:hypothetical protein